MIYLSGTIRKALIGTRPDIGVMIQPGMWNQVDLTQTLWGADNGCFAKPERFDLGKYLAWLAKRQYAAGTCLFATGPDVLGDARATWDRSLPVFGEIRALGLPAALVAQDGIEALELDWGAFDVVFLGGSTAWKLSHHARELTLEANKRQRWVHMGRVNSYRRLRTAAMWGVDSCDGTFLGFGPDRRTPELLGWLDDHKAAPTLNFGGQA